MIHPSRMLVLPFFVLMGATCATAVEAAETGDAATRQVDFDRDIRPILSDRCFACHGPDAAERKAGLRLDQAESAYGPADSGEAAVVPGDPEASLLVARIFSDDPYEVMPPPESHKSLNDHEKNLLRQWIADGAAYSPHWSLVPPRREPLPEIDDAEGISDPIDAFILDRLDRAGLTANPPADRRALLRRVTFDLTGLPPTPEALSAFEADASADAYERVVDRLLESPRYGEHMARYWLDLVRYGDTHGLHLDNYREMWPYRDWVIAAFNENKPFDEFIIEQLAGDLLPNATLQDQVASGFNRLNVTTSEGGSIYEEVFARNVIDRTDAFGTIFLGLTTGCAVCHDHKFDPISQKDFYSLSAFFNSLDGQALDGNVKDHPPSIRVPTAEHLEQLAEVAAMRADLQAEMNGPLPAVDSAQQRWAQSIAAGDSTSAEWVPLMPDATTSSGGATLETRDDGTVRATGTLPAKNVVTIEAPLPAGRGFQLIRLEVPTDAPDKAAGRSDNGNAVLSEFEVAIRTAATGNEFLPVKLVYAEADHHQTDGAKFSIDYAIDGKVEGDAGWAIGGHQKPGPRSAWFVAAGLLEATDDASRIRVTLKYESQYAGHEFGQVRLSLSDSPPKVSADRQLVLSPWHMVGPFETENAGAGYYTSFASQDRAFDAAETFKYRDAAMNWQTLDGFQPAVVNPLPAVEGRPSVVLLHRRITAPSPQQVRLLLGTEDGYQIWMDGKKLAEVEKNRSIAPLAEEISIDLKQGDNDVYLKVIHHDGPAAFATALRSPAAPVPESIVAIAAKPLDARSDIERESLKHYYRRVASIHPDWLVLRDMSEGLRKRQEQIKDSMPTTLVWKETAQPRTAHILTRGEYDQPGEAVVRDVPAALPPMDPDAPRDRLGLAQWLVSADHPLTARVAVNRFWQQLFGTGLVKTSEDFGAQGEPPSHPKLLDLLAVDFQQDGWDVKHLMKRLVMSSAYRRDSRVEAAHLAVDPTNRLLARGPRFRLDAEAIRDAALFTSGLLVEKLGGPSVKPPQPKGLWYAVGYTSSNTANFVADTGDKIYRRSVYTFWKRTSPPPQMSTFDAPSRERCTARRERTNTPLQALMLLNEPQYLESARHLAARSEAIAGDDWTSRLRWQYETVTSRLPTADELDQLQTLLVDLTRIYTEDAELFQRTGAADPQSAAGIVVASTLLNLDAALNK